MLRAWKNSIICIIGLLGLNNCAPRVVLRCPIEVPEAWRKMAYEQMTTGFMFDGDKVVLTKADAKAVVKNQVMCEKVRRGLVDLIDDSTTIK